jgi:hypothetical protein
VTARSWGVITPPCRHRSPICFSCVQRARGNPEGLALIDRALAILGKARAASPADVAQLEAEIADLADDLAKRYGAPAGSLGH